MAYNSFIYLGVFLVLTYGLWAVMPRRGRPFVLLGASVLFYWYASGRYILWIAAAAVVIWLAGLTLGRLDELFAAAKPHLEGAERKAFRQRVGALKKGTVAAAAALVLGVFIWLKYSAYFANAWNALPAKLPLLTELPVPDYVLPLGLSYYSLMAVSYLVDVYRGTCRPAGAFWRVALYLCFWPHIVEGPFDRYGALEEALCGAEQKPDYRNFTFGAQRILWGMLKKVVIADRANMFVNAVFNDSTQYSGIAVVLGTLLYTLQIYAEFSGCIDIVLGSAELFGIPLAENFRQPFFSRSVSEFWRRWHITLGAWLREYLFQPFIMSKPVLKFGKKCREKFGPAAGRNWPVRLGLVITWVAIGLWHGAATIYLVYGLYYCFLQLLGEIAEPGLLKLLPHLPEWRKTKWYAAFQIARTFVLVNFGMLLFRASSLQAALGMLTTLNDRYSGSLLIKLDARDMGVLAAGALLILAVDLLHERGVHIRAALAAKPLPLRWAVYIGAVLIVMVFGAYGDNYDPAAFIYAQF